MGFIFLCDWIMADACFGAPTGMQHGILPSIAARALPDRKNARHAIPARLICIKGSE
jgi:hypothetical protein